MKKEYYQKSFTLIELLVVIAIIGLLAAIVLVSLSGTVAEARDAKRIQELNTIRSALILYYDKFGDYPITDPDSNTDIPGCYGIWDGGTILAPAGDTFIKELADIGFLKKVPIEEHPISGVSCSYKYIRKTQVYGNDGHSNECTQPFIVLWARMESDSTPVAQGDERPQCVLNWIANHYPLWEGAPANKDYAIWIPYWPPP